MIGNSLGKYMYVPGDERPWQYQGSKTIKNLKNKNKKANLVLIFIHIWPSFIVRSHCTTYEDGQHSGKTEAEGAGLCLHLEEHRLPLQRCQFKTAFAISSFQHKIVKSSFEDCVGLLHRADVEVLRWQNGTRGDNGGDHDGSGYNHAPIYVSIFT